MKNALFAFVLLFSVLTATAAEAKTTLTAHIDGLVCDFCARALEKTFSTQSAVDGIKVDLTAKTVSITMKDGQNLSEETINKLITDAGYTLRSIDPPKSE